MTRTRWRTALAVLTGLTALFTAHARADDWTLPVEVTYNQIRCIAYRARLSGAYLEVEAKIEPGWHTFAMDSAQRAAEKLAGRKSLSQDAPTEIGVTEGLIPEGPWYQTPPKDFSKPELRWFSWGFVDRVSFAVKAARAGAGPARVEVRGQVCTESVCKKIDIVIGVPLGASATDKAPSDIILESLVPVR